MPASHRHFFLAQPLFGISVFFHKANPDKKVRYCNSQTAAVILVRLGSDGYRVRHWQFCITSYFRVLTV
jgi:hypothetical protein